MERARNGIFNTFQARLLIALLFCGWLSLGLVGLILALTGRIAFTDIGIPFIISLIFSSFISLGLMAWLLPVAKEAPQKAAPATETAAEDEVALMEAAGDSITDVDAVDSNLWEAQRLESLGLLAGGIAHDFNNLLTGMLGNASLVQAMLEPDDPAQAQVTRLMSTAGRAADLARQLLAYAGKAAFEIGPIDLNRFLDENARLLETAMPRRVDLKLEMTQPLPKIEGDRGQIQQILMNLVINAAESMPPAGGLVTVATEETVVDPEQLVLVDGVVLPAGSYICLVVKDNGLGMDKVTLAKIFDPFFTTKEQGHGLGLSASLGIMRTHNGGIEVASVPGQGSIFRLYFPARHKVVNEPRTPTVNKDHLKGTVLIVDDDHDVRRVAADILATLGMHVLEAQHGRAGLECYEEHDGNVDVVLLDVKMPVMDGEDTYRALKALDPDAQIVVSTGYGEVEAAALLEELGASEFLSKPYDFEALVNKMRTLVPTP